MYNTRFQELMTRGYALRNKIRFEQWNPDEFDRWIEECLGLLSCCEPEPYFPLFPDHEHIEVIVMLLSATMGKISRREIQYLGLP